MVRQGERCVDAADVSFEDPPVIVAEEVCSTEGSSIEDPGGSVTLIGLVTGMQVPRGFDKRCALCAECRWNKKRPS